MHCPQDNSQLLQQTAAAEEAACLHVSAEWIRGGSLPETEEDSTGILAQLVVWDDVCKLPPHVAYVLQNRVAFLPFAHKDGIGIDLENTACTLTKNIQYAVSLRSFLLMTMNHCRSNPTQEHLIACREFMHGFSHTSWNMSVVQQ